MFGDSLTYEGDWSKLLHRDDIINAGVSGDSTHTMLYRLDSINLSNISTVCIMAGINDIFLYGERADDIFERYQMIIEHFKKQNLHVIILSTLYVTSHITEYQAINSEVDILNRYLQSYDVLDINSYLTQNGALQPCYSSDGVHLTPEAYKIWRDRLLGMLK
jgi:lysophospholipase L1-like esterase